MWTLSPEEWTAVLLSLRVAGVAILASLPVGIAIAWLLARCEFWGKTLLNGLVHLPLVLPPVVTGYLLLLSFAVRRRCLISAVGLSSFSLTKICRRDGPALHGAHRADDRRHRQAARRPRPHWAQDLRVFNGHPAARRARHLGGKHSPSPRHSANSAPPSPSCRIFRVKPKPCRRPSIRSPKYRAATPEPCASPWWRSPFHSWPSSPPNCLPDA
jgi:hypothetical protein